MRRIEIRSGPDGHEVVSFEGQATDRRLEMSSDPAITFPAVWLDDERVYAVEVWREDGLALSVPPRSDDVDRAFDQHEQRRSGAGGADTAGH